MKTLGLDISTTTVGMCVLDENEKILYIDYFSLKKCKDLFQKADLILKHVEDLIKTHGITHVWVEEALIGFHANASSAATISKLIAFNSIVSYGIYVRMNMRVNYLNVNTARRVNGIKVHRKPISKLPGKEQVFQCAISGLIDHNLLPRNKKQEFSPEARDCVDAWVIARAGMRLGQN